MNPVQHQIDMLRGKMQVITQAMASLRLAYEEAHGPGSSSDVSAVGDMANERAKHPIDSSLIWNFLLPINGEITACTLYFQ